MASILAPTIVGEVARREPDIARHLTEIFGGVLTDAIKNGKIVRC